MRYRGGTQFVCRELHTCYGALSEVIMAGPQDRVPRLQLRGDAKETPTATLKVCAHIALTSPAIHLYRSARGKSSFGRSDSLDDPHSLDDHVVVRGLHSYALLLAHADARLLLLSIQNRVQSKQPSHKLKRWCIIQLSRWFNSHTSPPCTARQGRT